MDKRKTLQQLSKIIRKQKSLGKACSLVDPKLRYLSEQQADEWIKIGRSVNVHTLSTENRLLKNNFQNIFPTKKRPLVIVDLGCGNGRKAVQLIVDLLESGYTIRKYVAVDVNQKLINAAIRLVVENTTLTKDACISACSSFEDLFIESQKSWGKSDEATVVYLLLGNTFNNFERDRIIKLLVRLVRKGEILLVGMKCRRNSSIKERQRIIQEYSSYGPDFTFSFGHLLGLSRGSMQRIVEYNSKRKRLEVYLKFNKPSTFMEKSGIGMCKRLHIFNSYKPTVEEARHLFSFHFKTKVYQNDDSTEAIFSCMSN